MNSIFLKDNLGSLANIYKKQGESAFSNFYGKSMGTLGNVMNSLEAGKGLPNLDMNDFNTGAKVLGTDLGAGAMGLPFNKVVEPVGNILERV